MQSLSGTNWPYPRVLAHRGAGTMAPENTLAAMQCGFEYGYRAVEFDVMLSKDGVPVLMHDPEFGRTVQAQTKGQTQIEVQTQKQIQTQPQSSMQTTGSVDQCLASELMQMDAGSWFSPAFAQAKVPSFEQVFDYCQRHGIWMNVEIKPVPGFEVETGRVVAAVTQELIKKAEAQITSGAALQLQAPLFSSFSFAALYAAKQQAPEIARGFLIDDLSLPVKPDVPPDSDELNLSDSVCFDWKTCLKKLSALALHTNHRHLTPELAQEIKAEGYGLFCYTVNTPERAREIRAWGVDGFCTDRIDLIPANF